MRQHVAVGAVLVPAAVLDLELRRLAAQVLADGGDGAVDVVGMDAASPRLEVRRDLGVLVAELPLPLRRVVDRGRDEAPFPEPDVAGADRALEPRLRLAEGRRRSRPLGLAAADVHGEADVHGHLVEKPHFVRVEPRGVGGAQDEHAADRVIARAQREAGHRAVAVRGGKRRVRRAVGEAGAAGAVAVGDDQPSLGEGAGRGTGRKRRVGDRGPQRLTMRGLARVGGDRERRRRPVRFQRDPGGGEAALLDGDAAGALEHRRQVPLADDDVVDVAEDRVDTVQPADPLRRDLLGGAVPGFHRREGRDRHEREQHQARRHRRHHDGESCHRVEIAGALAPEPRPPDRQRQDQRDRQHAPKRGAADPVGDDGAHQAGRRSHDEHPDGEREKAESGVRRERREGGAVMPRALAEHVAFEGHEGEESHRQRHRLARPDAPASAGVQGQQCGPDQREVEGGDH